jgi:hypothetical protein
MTQNLIARRKKLMSIGLSYDLANAKCEDKEPENPAVAVGVTGVAQLALAAIVDASN